jgi:VanZ family protein
MLRRTLLILTTIYAITLVTVTHLPPAHLPATGVSDKVEHVTGYGLLATLVATTVMLHTRRVPVVMLVLSLAAFGAIDEVTQPIFGRTADVWDWAADLTGIVLATAIVWAVNCVRNTGCARDEVQPGATP